MSTFSSTVSAGKTLVFWNVRTSPRAAMRQGRQPVIVPAVAMPRAPRSGAGSPVITLKAVVLPAPLGPIRLVTVARRDREAHPGQRGHAAEAHREVAHLEIAGLPSPAAPSGAAMRGATARRAGTMPCGMKNSTAMSRTP